MSSKATSKRKITENVLPSSSNKAIKLDTPDTQATDDNVDTYTSKQALFWGITETSLYLQGLLYDAICDLDHPESGRFGAHFLLFPLLCVNRNLRKNVGTYLFNRCFVEHVPNLHYPHDIRTTTKFVITRYTLHEESEDERNDPRYWYSHAQYGDKHKDTDHYILMYKAHFAADGINLKVTFAIDPRYPEVISQESSENIATGTKYDQDVFSAVSMFSDAAFTPVLDPEVRDLQEQLEMFDPVTDWDIFGMTVCDIGMNMTPAKRWGLRSAVPLPEGWQIGNASPFTPNWPETCKPGDRIMKDEQWNGYTVSYTTGFHTSEDFMNGSTSMIMDLEDMPQKKYNHIMDKFMIDYFEGKEQLERKEFRPGMRRRLVALRIQSVSGSLMRFLRPSVTRRDLS